jgi:hypothetical protein
MRSFIKLLKAEHRKGISNLYIYIYIYIRQNEEVPSNILEGQRMEKNLAERINCHDYLLDNSNLCRSLFQR